MKIIIARYNEDISWIKQLKYDNKDILIYNKGSSLNIPNEILLENVGREGHTFYKYIYDHYDELDDYTIFLQGNPFDHLPNTISILNKIMDKQLTFSFKSLSKNLLLCNLIDCKYHKNLPLASVYLHLFHSIKPELKFLFGPGGQFIVHKLEILRHPKEFYLKIIKLLEYHKNPIEGFVIERFHPIIFNHYILNNSFEQLKLYNSYYKPFTLLFTNKK
jgi:hypothetical protein